MNTQMADVQQLVEVLVKEEVARQTQTVPVGVSNRHVHLNRADMDVLFGTNSMLTMKKPLGQPGQFAAEEVVTLEGPRGTLEKVRVLGPLRSETQVEISVTDGRALGLTAPVRESGRVAGTPGLKLMGPCGTVELDHGVIAALRHIHVTPYLAEQLALHDGELVSVEIGSDVRGGRMDRVLVRVSERFSPEMHVDVDEANAYGIRNDDMAKILTRG